MNEYAVVQTVSHVVILRADDPNDAVARYDQLMISPTSGKPYVVSLGEKPGSAMRRPCT